MFRQNHIVAVVPARDEAPSIGKVITDITAIQNINGEPVFDRVLVCDNGSIDATAAIARALGAEVFYEPTPGYGAACLKALSCVSDTDIVVFIDADQSLDISEAPKLIAALCSLLIRLIWGVAVTDLGPFRAIRWAALNRLNMQDRSFGWTVEMQVKAIQFSLRMVEVPVHYHKRLGQSKISGTISGVVGAGFGIISTIIKLAFNPLSPRLARPIINR